MVGRGTFAIAVVGTLCLVAGSGYARDPNKVRCCVSSEDGSTLTAEYERERREFRADFQVGDAGRDFEDRMARMGAGSAFAPGDVLNVLVNNVVVGRIVLGQSLSGRLEFDEKDKPFPANFPPFPPGTVTTVGTLSCVGQRR